jgi:hypothetical protein
MEDTSICQYLKGLKRNIQKGKKKIKKIAAGNEGSWAKTRTVIDQREALPTLDNNYEC